MRTLPHIGWLMGLFFLASSGMSQVVPNFGGQRAGLSSLSFLKNDMSPRSMALSGSSVALPGDGFSLYNNPAGAAEAKSLTFATSNLLVGAGINQTLLSSIIPTGEHSNIGISINSLSPGSMEVRTEFQPEGTGQKFFASNVATGLSFSKELSDQFSLGITMKYIYEKLAQYTNHTATADLGFLYSTDFKDLKFAVLIQNFGGNSSLNGDFLEVNFNRNAVVELENYTVPTVFKMGMSLVPWTQDKHSLLVSWQLDHPNDNAENIRLGAEYNYLDLFYVRAGYKVNVAGQQYPSFGLGLRSRIGAHPLHINYASNPTNYLGIQHSLGLSFTFNNDKRGGDDESR